VVAYCVDEHGGSTSNDDENRNTLQKLIGSLALGLIALGCGWTAYANLTGARHEDVLTAPTITVITAQPAVSAVAAADTSPAPRKRSILTAPVFDVALLDATRAFGPPLTFSQSAPLKSALQQVAQPVRQIVQAIPAPAPRPAVLQATTQRGNFALASAADTPFDRLFGKPRETGTALAYAAPDGGVFNDGQSKSPGRLPATDGQTAVYDISARTVYMPDGTKLEAHSGLRDKLDDPRYVNVKMHGATPPHTYDLVPREALFHGVQALRMIPVGGESEIFGRTGLLAHSYMLGPNGDSNGCVSFRDYDAFLRAYQNGKVKRLVVVARGGQSIMTASN
jgi:hypothetical protein